MSYNFKDFDAQFPDDAACLAHSPATCRQGIVANIYQWMARQKFPLNRAGVEKVSSAKLAELRAAGIKYVSILTSGRICAACRSLKNQKIEIEFATTFPLPGCEIKNCQCIYLAEE